MDIIIRRANESDADAVAELARLGWDPIYDGFRTAITDKIYNEIYKDPIKVKMQKMREAVLEGRVFVAETDGAVCAFASYLIEGTVGSLKENSVHPDYKGNGIAGKLYNTLLELLRESGCKVVKVMTGLDEAHAPARRAYEKLGFNRSISSVTYYMEL
jgi:GNAT superfamily N-acetyltransferase